MAEQEAPIAGPLQIVQSNPLIPPLFPQHPSTQVCPERQEGVDCVEDKVT